LSKFHQARIIGSVVGNLVPVLALIAQFALAGSVHWPLVSDMKIDIDNAERQFLERLRRLGAATVQDIGDALQVTATAVRQRLSRLHGLGLIEREVQRAGRGRPHHLYRVSEQALRVLGDNYNELALILWREFQKISNPETREALRQNIQNSMAARFSSVSQGTTLQERLEILRSLMQEKGYSVEIQDRDGSPVLRETNCPYHDLANDDRTICEMEEEVFSKLLGVPFKLTSCCQDASHHCEFEVAVHDIATSV